MIFNANCMLRLSTTVDVMRPAFGLPMALFGNPKPGWLNRLNTSHRNLGDEVKKIDTFALAAGRSETAKKGQRAPEGDRSEAKVARIMREVG